MSDDEELAERFAAKADSKSNAPRRRMSDWSATVEVLTMILDRLGELTQAVAALGGAKSHKVPRAPHPVTAVDRIRTRRRYQRHRSLVDRVLRRPAPTE